jgi:hypothetical protein
MQIELSEKEIEIIINMLTESLNKTSDGIAKLNFSVDELILLEKMEIYLKEKDLDNISSKDETSIKSKYLN